MKLGGLRFDNLKILINLGGREMKTFLFLIFLGLFSSVVLLSLIFSFKSFAMPVGNTDKEKISEFPMEIQNVLAAARSLDKKIKVSLTPQNDLAILFYQEMTKFCVVVFTIEEDWLNNELNEKVTELMKKFKAGEIQNIKAVFWQSEKGPLSWLKKDNRIVREIPCECPAILCSFSNKFCENECPLKNEIEA